MVAELCKHTKVHWLVQLKCVKCVRFVIFLSDTVLKNKHLFTWDEMTKWDNVVSRVQSLFWSAGLWWGRYMPRLMLVLMSMFRGYPEQVPIYHLAVKRSDRMWQMMWLSDVTKIVLTWVFNFLSGCVLSLHFFKSPKHEHLCFPVAFSEGNKEGLFNFWLPELWIISSPWHLD